MSSYVDSTVPIQTSAESALPPLSWFGEAVFLALSLKQQGILEAMNERVRFAHLCFLEIQITSGLQFKKMGVGSIEGQQVLMCPILNDLAMLDYQYTVSHAHC